MSGDRERSHHSQLFKLEADSELRFELDGRSDKITIELRSGSAEIFGTELAKGRYYTFSPGARIAVFTWHGCILELKGEPDFLAISKKTPMVMYLNAHAMLELLRQKADAEGTKGPVALVLGPADVGKTSLSRILLNYAVKMGRKPIFVDLNVSQGVLSIPGTIGAVQVERQLSPEEGFSQLSPLIYHYGHKKANQNITLFNMLVSHLSEVIRERIEDNLKARTSGMIITIKGDIFTQVIQAVLAFEVNVIIVLDQERLYSDLIRELPPFVKVICLPKSAGVPERSQQTRSDIRSRRVAEYFNGLQTPLHSHTFDLRFSDVRIYKIGHQSGPDPVTFIGSKPDEATKLVSVQPGNSLLYRLLAVTCAASTDENVIQSNVMGYICVTNVDSERQTMTVLSPQPRPLPRTLLLLSDVRFIDNR